MGKRSPILIMHGKTVPNIDNAWENGPHIDNAWENGTHIDNAWENGIIRNFRFPKIRIFRDFGFSEISDFP